MQDVILTIANAKGERVTVKEPEITDLGDRAVVPVKAVKAALGVKPEAKLKPDEVLLARPMLCGKDITQNKTRGAVVIRVAVGGTPEAVEFYTA